MVPVRSSNRSDKRGLAVIDMRDDAEIAGQLDRHEARTMRARPKQVNRASSVAARSFD